MLVMTWIWRIEHYCADGFARDAVAPSVSACVVRKCELNLLRHMRSQLRATPDFFTVSVAAVNLFGRCAENSRKLQ